ncbi:hypothetical protein AV645_07720 [Acinetobacter calcoaceticus]|uniref:Uncharacterized protein n=1 Tax=Acinetobacter oleivorans TaxID=1148157 RepID=A0A0B2UE14_9GAMM|nr:hypothetical protein DH17_15400 [Acinetobacter oleivorans]KUM11552.1 hypothetical protein AV645_07720 [Acinetobacter calcoaceticus]
MGEGNLLVVIVTFQRVNHHMHEVAIQALVVVRLVRVLRSVLVVEPKIVWGRVETNIALLWMAINAIAKQQI